MATIAKTLSDAFHQNWKIATDMGTEESCHEADVWSTSDMFTDHLTPEMTKAEAVAVMEDRIKNARRLSDNEVEKNTWDRSMDLVRETITLD